MGRMVIYLSASNVREYAFTVTFITRNDCCHLGKACCVAVCFVVVKRETHSQGDASLKAPASICEKLLGVIMTTAFDQKRVDHLNDFAVEIFSWNRHRLSNVNNTNNN